MPGSYPQVDGYGDDIHTGGEKTNQKNCHNGGRILGETANHYHEQPGYKERIAKDTFLTQPSGTKTKEQGTGDECYLYSDTQRPIKGVVAIVYRRLLESHMQVLSDEGVSKHCQCAIPDVY